MCFTLWPFSGYHRVKSDQQPSNKMEVLEDLPLPDELLLSIFDTLNTPQDLINASSVCRRWRHCTQRASLWEKFKALEDHSFPRLNIERKLYSEEVYHHPEDESIKAKSILKLENRVAYVLYENGDFCSLDFRKKKVEKKGNFPVLPKNIQIMERKAIIWGHNIKIFDIPSGAIEKEISRKDFPHLSKGTLAMWNDVVVIFDSGRLILINKGETREKTLLNLQSPQEFSIKVFHNWLLLQSENKISVWKLDQEDWLLRNCDFPFDSSLLNDNDFLSVFLSNEDDRNLILHFKNKYKEVKKWFYFAPMQLLNGITTKGTDFFEIPESHIVLLNLSSKKHWGYPIGEGFPFKAKKIEYYGPFIVFNRLQNEVFDSTFDVIWKMDGSHTSLSKFKNSSLSGGVFYEITKEGAIEIIDLKSNPFLRNKVVRSWKNRLKNALCCN